MTRLSGSLIENYQTELGLCALIWRKKLMRIYIAPQQMIWRKQRDAAQGILI